MPQPQVEDTQAWCMLHGHALKRILSKLRPGIVKPAAGIVKPAALHEGDAYLWVLRGSNAGFETGRRLWARTTRSRDKIIQELKDLFNGAGGGAAVVAYPGGGSSSEELESCSDMSDDDAGAKAARGPEPATNSASSSSSIEPQQRGGPRMLPLIQALAVMRSHLTAQLAQEGPVDILSSQEEGAFDAGSVRSKADRLGQTTRAC